MPSNDTHHYVKATEEAVIKGQSVLRELNTMINEGINPRIVISHGGMGLGLYIKEIVPNAIHIGLFEWYFQANTSKWLVKDFNLDARLMTRARNLPIIDEILTCDIGVVPTQWQKNQFPIEFQDRLVVIFDGIDKSFFSPNKTIDTDEIFIKGEYLEEPIKIDKSTKILSYATRGMEPLRGFPEFIRAASYALKNIDDLLVIIAGRDRVAYSYKAESFNGSWKESVLDELGNFEGRERMIFTGLMPYMDYRKLLQRSNLHCYFTRPYVTSWSLFEAAACGSKLCINSCEATKEVVENEKDVNWVNLDDAIKLRETIIESITYNTACRARLKKKYELNQCLTKWQALINEQIRKQA